MEKRWIKTYVRNAYVAADDVKGGVDVILTVNPTPLPLRCNLDDADLNTAAAAAAAAAAAEEEEEEDATTMKA